MARKNKKQRKIRGEVNLGNAFLNSSAKIAEEYISYGADPHFISDEKNAFYFYNNKNGNKILSDEKIKLLIKNGVSHTVKGSKHGSAISYIMRNIDCEFSVIESMIDNGCYDKEDINLFILPLNRYFTDTSKLLEYLIKIKLLGCDLSLLNVGDVIWYEYLWDVDVINFLKENNANFKTNKVEGKNDYYYSYLTEHKAFFDYIDDEYHETFQLFLHYVSTGKMNKDFNIGNIHYSWLIEDEVFFENLILNNNYKEAGFIVNLFFEKNEYKTERDCYCILSKIMKMKKEEKKMLYKHIDLNFISKNSHDELKVLVSKMEKEVIEFNAQLLDVNISAENKKRRL